MTCVSTLAPTCLCLISLKSATESPFLKTTFKRYMKAMASRLMVDIYAYSEWKQTIASMSFDGIPMNIGNLHGMTRCSKYLCFAETAWGDQYAYHIDELRKG